MREILFRGFHEISSEEKVYVNGEWIKGYWVEGGIYYQKSDEVKEETVYIIGGSLNDVGCAYKIIPETVGQYTGLKDKNGKKIFEGDIVLLKGDEEPYTVEFDECCFQVFGDSVCYCMDNFYDHDIEIIGNIHSNPELSEV